jgi:hypothetical protein
MSTSTSRRSNSGRISAVHGHRERLRAAHPAESGGDGQRALERAPEALLRHRGEGFVGSLQDSLRTDVDPGTGGHLAVHRQAELFETTEFRPVGPVSDEVRVGEEHARRPLVRAEHTDRLAGLHQQRLVGFQRRQLARDGVEARPVTRGLARAAVDDQVFGALGDVRVEVVVEHPHRGFGLPVLGGQRGAPGGTHRAALAHQSSSLATASRLRIAPDATSSSAAAISGAR